MIAENISTLKIHKLTQAQYDRELAAGNIDETALYLTPSEANDDAVDLTSDQTVAGVKTFSDGIIIGDNGVHLTYDSTEGAMRLTFLSSASTDEGGDEIVEEEVNTDEADTSE